MLLASISQYWPRRTVHGQLRAVPQQHGPDPDAGVGAALCPRGASCAGPPWTTYRKVREKTVFMSRFVALLTAFMMVLV